MLFVCEWVVLFDCVDMYLICLIIIVWIIIEFFKKEEKYNGYWYILIIINFMEENICKYYFDIVFVIKEKWNILYFSLWIFYYGFFKI